MYRQNKFFKKWVFFFGLILAFNPFFSCVSSSLQKSLSTRIESSFRTIPDSITLSIYWYWINGNISKEGVRKDLISMKRAGIGRAYIGNIGLDSEHGDPKKEVKLFSDEWWRILYTTFKVADSLEIEIGIFNSPGWSQSGGPWVNPTSSMRYLKSEVLNITGGEKIETELKSSNKNFQRVAVLAIPSDKDSSRSMKDLGARVSANREIKDIENLIDGDLTSLTSWSNDNQSLILDIVFEERLTARSLLIYPSNLPIKFDIDLQVKGEGAFKSIKKFEFNRLNPSINVGFLPTAPVVVSFNAEEGKEFRLILSNLEGNSLSEIKLTSQSYLDRFYEKQLARMNQTPLPMWDAYMWEAQEIDYPDSSVLRRDEIIDITRFVDSDGVLSWQAPKGDWSILQFGMLPTGVTNAPAAKEATGLEIDKMNKIALKKHFDGFIGKILDHFKPSERKAFKYVVADSYETGSETWTDGMKDEFIDRYGYNPIVWLPVLNGYIVEDADKSNRFLWDLRRMIADQIAYQYVGGLRELSNQNGLKIWLENYGHWGFPAEFLQYGGQSNEIGGEFWAEGELGSIELYAASSAANIYGKKKVFAESFTASGKTFARYPASLKKRGDWSFANGVNSTLLHVYISQPDGIPKPGINAWFGTEFNRNNTWFRMAKPYFDYLRRCNFMLQQGWPVKDVAYFIGEDAPKMTGTQAPPLPRGYSFDYINGEAIMSKLSIKDGNWVLPNGISYKILVLPPQHTMRPAILKRLMRFVKEGGTILGPIPDYSPSLKDFPEADIQIQSMAKELWQDCDGINKKEVNYGKGKVINGMSLDDFFEKNNIVPDLQIDEGVPVFYTHRRGDLEMYFLSNQSDSLIRFNATFRVSGKVAELWDPITGEIRRLNHFERQKEKTTIPMKLDKAQSVFIVFKDSNKEIDLAQKIDEKNPEFLFEVNNSWSVTFDTLFRGKDKTIEFPYLIDWSTSTNDFVKYYSGEAIYSTSFFVDDYLNNKQFYLNLGNVMVMAEVTLNNINVGSVWTYPWELVITSAIKKGRNKLEIKVVNTWVNRLIGDSKLPLGQRETQLDFNPYTGDSSLQPSGLIGPVTILGK